MCTKTEILVVDDDQSTCRSLKLIFDKKGYETDCALTGKEALDKTRKRPFNITLLDVKLPDVEGIDLITPLKEMRPEMMVMVLTGYASLDIAVKALNYGASAFVTKPLNMDEVLAKVAEVREKQRLIEEKRIAEQELKESEERFRLLFESSSDGISMVDKQTKKFVIFNDRFCEMLGYGRDEIKSLGIFDIHPKEELPFIMSTFEQVAESGQTTEIDVPVIRKDGSIFFVNISGDFVKFKGKEYLFGSFRDITDRIKKEEDLRDTVSRLETIFEITPVVAVQGFDCEGTILQWNTASKNLYGYSPTEVVEKRFQDLLLDGQAAKDFEKTLRNISSSGRAPEPREWQLKTKEGVNRWVYSAMFPIFAEGEVSRIIRMDLDITQRKKIEEELLFKSALLEAQSETTTEGILVVAPGGKVVSYNKRFEELMNLLGASLDSRDIEIMVKEVMDQVKDPNILWERVSFLKEDKEAKSSEEVEFKDGRVYEEYSSPLISKEGEYFGRVIYFRDITEQKKSESLLKIRAYDLGERVKELNCLYRISDIVEKTGVSLEEMLLQVVNLIPSAWQYPDITCTRINLDYEEFKTENFKETPWRLSSNILVYGALAGTIEVFYLEDMPQMEVGPFLNVEKRMVESIANRLGIIIAQKWAEDALKESEERFRVIFDSAIDGILLADIETKRFFIGNKAFCNMLGYDLDELKNLGVDDIHPEKDIPYVLEQFEKQAKKEITLAKDIPVKRKDGSVFYADVNSTPLALAGKTYLMGMFRDVTERKQMGDALRESEERFKVIFENSIDGMLLADVETKKFFASNKSISNMLGYTVDEIEKLGVNDIHYEKDLPYAIDQFEKLAKEDIIVATDIPVKRKDGSKFFADIKTTKVKLAGKTYLLGIFRDVSDRHR